jgi:hypothetical protein
MESSGFAGLGVGLGILALAFVVIYGVIAIFIHIGTALAGIENRSFGRAFGAALMIHIVGSIIAAIVAVFQPLLGFGVFHLLGWHLLRGVYDTGFGRALVAYLLSMIVPVILVGSFLIFYLGISL